MSPDKAWKQFERRIAKSLGTVRTPLSGGASRHTSADTLHPDLYVECKQRGTSATCTWFLITRREAKKENKAPVLALHQSGSPHTLAVIDWDFFLELWDMAEMHADEYAWPERLRKLWGKD